MNYNELINQIINVTGISKKKLVAILMEDLDLSQSAAYNKLNQNSKFSFEEIYLICQKHNISLDQFIFNKKLDEIPHPFYSDALRSMPRTHLDYLRNIQMHTAGLTRLPNIRVTMLLNELSVFHLIQYDQLMYLKLFIWNLASWHDRKQFKEYDPYSLLDHEDYKSTKKSILNSYLNIKTQEVWSPHMLYNLVSNINFLLQENLLSDTLKKSLKSDILQLVDDIDQVFIDGRKVDSSSLEQKAEINIWLNETIIPSDTIFIQSPQSDVVFQMFDVPNYIRSPSPAICNHTKTWIGNIINQSTEITHSSVLKRISLINRFKKSIDVINW